MASSNRPLSRLFDLSGRTVAVIGAGSGIGAAIAEGCAAHGAAVRCLDRDGDAAGRTAAGITATGGSAEGATLDLLDAAELRHSLEALRRDHGRLDGLVVTPGVNVRKPLLAYSTEEFQRVVRLNFEGAFLALREGGRLLAEQGSGSIVLLSSIRSLVVEPGQGVYAATKAAIVQLARAAAAELGPRGVRVNAIAPGVVETPLTAPIQQNPDWHRAYAEKSALRRWAQPWEMAGAAVFLLSDAASYVTGTVLFVDGGWTAVDGRFTPPGMETAG